MRATDFLVVICETDRTLARLDNGNIVGPGRDGAKEASYLGMKKSASNARTNQECDNLLPIHPLESCSDCSSVFIRRDTILEDMTKPVITIEY